MRQQLIRSDPHESNPMKPVPYIIMLTSLAATVAVASLLLTRHAFAEANVPWPDGLPPLDEWNQGCNPPPGGVYCGRFFLDGEEDAFASGNPVPVGARKWGRIGLTNRKGCTWPGFRWDMIVSAQESTGQDVLYVAELYRGPYDLSPRLRDIGYAAVWDNAKSWARGKCRDMVGQLRQ